MNINKNLHIYIGPIVPYLSLNNLLLSTFILEYYNYQSV